MITLDTSAVLALLDRDDADHSAVRQAVGADRGPWLVPAGLLAEVASMLQSRFVAEALPVLLTDLERGEYMPGVASPAAGRRDSSPSSQRRQHRAPGS